MADVDPGHSPLKEENAVALNEPTRQADENTQVNAITTKENDRNMEMEILQAQDVQMEDQSESREREVQVDEKFIVNDEEPLVPTESIPSMENTTHMPESHEEVLLKALADVEAAHKLKMDLSSDENMSLISGANHADNVNIPAINAMPTPPEYDHKLDGQNDLVMKDIVTPIDHQNVSLSSPALAAATLLAQPFPHDLAYTNTTQPLDDLAMILKSTDNVKEDFSLIPFDTALINGNDMPIDGTAVNNGENYAGYNAYDSQPEEARISAYAKLSFDYGYDYYMNTFSIIIGREENNAIKDEHGDASTTNAMLGNHTTNGISRSSALETPSKSKKRKGKKIKGHSHNKSSSSSSHHNSLVPQTPTAVRQQAVASLTPEAPVEEVLSIRHPDGQPVKNISRRHAKIAYNFELRRFELEPLGKNGIFVDKRHYKAGSKAPLANQSQIQLGRIEFSFLLPDVDEPEMETQMFDFNDEFPLLETQKQRMSLDFEDESGRKIVAKKSIAISDSGEVSSSDLGADGEGDDEDDANGDIEDEGENSMMGAGSGLNDDPSDMDLDDEEEDENADPSAPPKPKPEKRGRGRPPKNGISVREQKLLAKQKEAEKAKKKQKDNAMDIKAKQTERELREQQKEQERQEKARIKAEQEKEKERRRQEKEEEKAKLAQAKEEKRLEQLRAKEAKALEAQAAKEQKVPKPPKEKKSKKDKRSPSPPPKESDYAPEELVKPSVSYSVMIFDAITNSQQKNLSLPDLYKAIENAYPYFKVKATTSGWQSSVRHNLRGCPDLFMPVAKEGKGFKWATKPGANVDKERKKKRGLTTPPPSRGVHMQSLPSGSTQSVLSYPQTGWQQYGYAEMRFATPVTTQSQNLTASNQYITQTPKYMPEPLPPSIQQGIQSLSGNALQSPSNPLPLAPHQAVNGSSFNEVLVNYNGTQLSSMDTPQPTFNAPQPLTNITLVNTATTRPTAPIPTLSSTVAPSSQIRPPTQHPLNNTQQRVIAAPIPVAQAVKPSVSTVNSIQLNQGLPQVNAPSAASVQQAVQPSSVVRTNTASNGPNSALDQKTRAALTQIQTALTQQLNANNAGRSTGSSSSASTTQLQSVLQTLGAAASGGNKSAAMKVLAGALKLMKPSGGKAGGQPVTNNAAAIGIRKLPIAAQNIGLNNKPAAPVPSTSTATNPPTVKPVTINQSPKPPMSQASAPIPLPQLQPQQAPLQAQLQTQPPPPPPPPQQQHQQLQATSSASGSAGSGTPASKADPDLLVKYLASVMQKKRMQPGPIGQPNTVNKITALPTQQARAPMPGPGPSMTGPPSMSNSQKRPADEPDMTANSPPAPKRVAT